MNRVVHFEINVANPSAIAAFYQRAFGWEFQQFGEHEYWLAKTGPDNKEGINGAIMPTEDGQPRTINTIEVPDIDHALAMVVEAGGIIDVERHEIPDVGWQAYCKDPGGNVFGLHQPF
ncbi:MAG TPA: VOC family protein [Nitriliruptorales bacterium]